MPGYTVEKDPEYGDWYVHRTAAGPFTYDEAVAARNAVSRVDRYAPRYVVNGAHVDDRTGKDARIYARSPEMAEKIAGYLNSEEPAKPLRYEIRLECAYDNQAREFMTPLECCDVMNAYQDEVMDA